MSGWQGSWEKALNDMEPEALDALIASHAEELTKEELGAITKVSESEE